MDQSIDQSIYPSIDRSVGQIATAVWIIDKLALRVGGEKGDDEADTVGCCSLRTEHLTFHENASVHEIELEFLGKDSMLFKDTIDFDKYGDIGTRVFKNLQAFCKGKRQSEEVFGYLDPRWFFYFAFALLWVALLCFALIVFFLFLFVFSEFVFFRSLSWFHFIYLVQLVNTILFDLA